jgi:hypothetical protein
MRTRRQWNTRARPDGGIEVFAAVIAQQYQPGAAEQNRRAHGDTGFPL